MKYFTNLKFDVWVCNPTVPVRMYFPVKYFIFGSYQFTQTNSVFSINFDLAPSWKRISLKTVIVLIGFSVAKTCSKFKAWSLHEIMVLENAEKPPFSLKRNYSCLEIFKKKCFKSWEHGVNYVSPIRPPPPPPLSLSPRHLSLMELT